MLPASWLQAKAQLEVSDAELEPLSEEEAAEAAEAEVRNSLTSRLLQRALIAGKGSKAVQWHCLSVVCMIRPTS